MIHKAKKSLGQNFLKSGSILRQIVEAGNITEGDIVLEIGPGKGALTTKLLEAGARVVAVEKDQDLIKILEEKFKAELQDGKLTLIEKDILEFEPDFKDYKIVANIPYNITGAILKKFLTSNNQPKSMTLLVQKEVADRIVAKDGKESILSISVKAYGEPRKLFKVPARFFSPEPRVDSAVIHISKISRGVFKENDVNEEKFWSLIRSGFANKRKKLSKNLKLAGYQPPDELENKRAEEISLNEWISLYKVGKKGIT